MESFFHSLKVELVWRTVFQTRAEAKAAIGRYIDGFYNPASQHPSGYVVENGRASWPDGDPAGWFGFRLA